MASVCGLAFVHARKWSSVASNAGPLGAAARAWIALPREVAATPGPENPAHDRLGAGARRPIGSAGRESGPGSASVRLHRARTPCRQRQSAPRTSALHTDWLSLCRYSACASRRPSAPPRLPPGGAPPGVCRRPSAALTRRRGSARGCMGARHPDHGGTGWARPARGPRSSTVANHPSTSPRDRRGPRPGDAAGSLWCNRGRPFSSGRSGLRGAKSK